MTVTLVNKLGQYLPGLALVVITLTLLLAGCDSDDEAGVGNSNNAGVPYSGRMVGTLTFDNTLLGVDLDSGRFSTLSGSDHLASLGVLNDSATLATRRDRSLPSGMLVTIDDCREDIDDTICLFFLDRDGNETSHFEIDGEFPGPAKLSFDGSRIAINRSDREGGNSTMTIYTREGEFVSNHTQSGGMNRLGGPYDWLPDGRLVYSREGNQLLGDYQPTGFIVTKPYDTIPDRLFTLPDYYQDGTIKSIETSPDGGLLLMNVSSRTGPYRPILVDSETFTITQLIDREDGGTVDVESIVWGPDSQWTYAVVSSSELLSGTALDSSQGSTVVFVGSSDSLFAYEVNDTIHKMPLYESQLSDSVRLIPTDRPRTPGGELGGGITMEILYGSPDESFSLHWISGSGNRPSTG